MNKYLELAKIMGSVSIVSGLVSSAIYLGFVENLISTYQFTDGREQIAASMFKFHLSELRYAYILFFITFLLAMATLFFAYKGYRDAK